MPDSNTLNQRQFIRLYHGTRADNIPGIKKEGLRPPAGTGPGWPMLTTSREQAARYAPTDNPVVVEFHVPSNRVYKSGRKNFDLWPPQEHGTYGYQAQAYALHQPLSPKYIKSIG